MSQKRKRRKKRGKKSRKKNRRKRNKERLSFSSCFVIPSQVDAIVNVCSQQLYRFLKMTWWKGVRG